VTEGATEPGNEEQARLADRAARRARREERRARQRAQNVVRAAKMHEARLAFERGQVEARAAAKGKRIAPGTFPAGASRAPSAKKLKASDEKLEAIVGCSGWFYWHWRNDFYPTGLPTSRWFEHYARTFRTVELNAPFYSWPTVGTVQGWVRQAGRRQFVYAVKVNELITHQKRFVGTKTLVRDFYHVADLLGPRLGCFLFQLPPSYSYTPGRLKSIVTQLDPARPNVVEFRHKSWWNQTVYAAFRKAGIVFCSCSGPRLPDELVKTADYLYVRFHGTSRWYRHDYTKEELAVWAGRIRASGARRVWAYFNNDREGYAIKNAKELIRQLKKR
jgi:uncharacterized protein YecE (DUF72 family)